MAVQSTRVDTAKQVFHFLVQKARVFVGYRGYKVHLESVDRQKLTLMFTPPPNKNSILNVFEKFYEIYTKEQGLDPDVEIQIIFQDDYSLTSAKPKFKQDPTEVIFDGNPDYTLEVPEEIDEKDRKNYEIVFECVKANPAYISYNFSRNRFKGYTLNFNLNPDLLTTAHVQEIHNNIASWLKVIFDFSYDTSDGELSVRVH